MGYVQKILTALAALAVASPLLSFSAFAATGNPSKQRANRHLQTAWHSKKTARIDGRASNVVIFGSSVADGWVDPTGGGYIRRAFAQYQYASAAPYNVISDAVPGAPITQEEGMYQQWIDTGRPQVLVISWGALDDAHAKTPFSVFDSQVRQQIMMGLAAHAVVLVVTPPVTKASYTRYKVLQPAYLAQEMAVAESFHSPNVFVFDVFAQMKQYLAEHNQTYRPYMANSWHPNSRGHELAGNLLFQDMLVQFGLSGIHFVTPAATANNSSSGQQQ